MYIDKLDDIVNEYNKTYHRTIKLNHIELKDNLYIYIYIYIYMLYNYGSTQTYSKLNI